jgi:hypothetical protein
MSKLPGDWLSDLQSAAEREHANDPLAHVSVGVGVILELIRGYRQRIWWIRVAEGGARPHPDAFTLLCDVGTTNDGNPFPDAALLHPGDDVGYEVMAWTHFATVPMPEETP